MGIRLCLGWETGALEELRCDQPFTLGGRKALLLGLVRPPEEGTRLWLLHEERGWRCPDVEPYRGTLRLAAIGRYMTSCEPKVGGVALEGEEIYQRIGEAGTVFECAAVKPDLLDYLMHRGGTRGGFDATSPYDVKIGLYTVRQDLDFAALADAGDLRFTLVFEGTAAPCPKRVFVNKPFVMPLNPDWEGNVRVEYDEPLRGTTGCMRIRRVRAFDVGSRAGLRDSVAYLDLDLDEARTKELVAGLAAAFADGDHLLFAEYDCVPGQSATLFLDSFLRRPTNPAARVVFDVNDILERRGGGKACLGFHAGIPAGAGTVEIFCRNDVLPEETVSVMARGTTVPDPDVARFREPDSTAAREIMTQLIQSAKSP